MSAENVCGDAIFMVQPEEMASYKSLRRVVDHVFVATERFFPSSITYADMEIAESGVNRHLRAMLFVPSELSSTGPLTGESTVRNTDSKTDSHANGSSAVKQSQRQSKQKERCENRLMSLLFATIYDPATRRCRLVQDVPPLKLRRADKNGQVRSVSNFTDVRSYLRNSMISVISAYTESVKVLSQLLPGQFGVLPIIFSIIGRTLLVITKIQSTDSAGADPEKLRKEAMAALDYSMLSIQNFITTWERRNFSTDNPLLHCLKAGTQNEHYAAVRKLLEVMISILPPTGREPYSDDFRAHHLFAYGVQSDVSCKNRDGQKCCLAHRCPGSKATDVRQQDTRYYVDFVDALSTCATLQPTMDIDSIEEIIKQDEFSPAAWRYCEGLCVIHRMQNVSEDIQHETHESERNSNTTEHLERLHWEVATCWSAFGRSNARTWRILESLKIDDQSALKETVTELVFGGAIAAIALFERQKEIRPICANLQSKKLPSVTRLKDDSTCDHGSVLVAKQHDNEERLVEHESSQKRVSKTSETTKTVANENEETKGCEKTGVAIRSLHNHSDCLNPEEQPVAKTHDNVPKTDKTLNHQVVGRKRKKEETEKSHGLSKKPGLLGRKFKARRKRLSKA